MDCYIALLTLPKQVYPFQFAYRIHSLWLNPTRLIPVLTFQLKLLTRLPTVGLKRLQLTSSCLKSVEVGEGEVIAYSKFSLACLHLQTVTVFKLIDSFEFLLSFV